MKFILPVVYSLLLIGCGDSATTKTAATVQNETQTLSTPIVPEKKTSTEPSTPPSAPMADKAVTAPTAAIDTGAIFGQKCASCHGAKAEKSSLGKSKIIANFTEQQIKDALHGYQDGTYGREMKAIMQGQAKALSDAQIDALAKYIPSL